MKKLLLLTFCLLAYRLNAADTTDMITFRLHIGKPVDEITVNIQTPFSETHQFDALNHSIARAFALEQENFDLKIRGVKNPLGREEFRVLGNKIHMYDLELRFKRIEDFDHFTELYRQKIEAEIKADKDKALSTPESSEETSLDNSQEIFRVGDEMLRHLEEKWQHPTARQTMP